MHKRIFAFLGVLFSFHLVHSKDLIQPQAIYGDDGRHEVYEGAAIWQKVSQSVGGFLFAKSYTELSDGGIQIHPETLKQRYELCDGESFENQPLGPDCSGFLVGGDLVITAGHCLRGKSCPRGVWIFNYEKEQLGRVRNRYTAAEVYRCSEVLSASKGATQDHGLLRLDRAPGLPFLKLSMKLPKRGDSLTVVGHPSGLPKKIGTGGAVRAIAKNGAYFTTNLDTFGGNSGSPVISESTGLVHGILVRGDEDYVPTEEGCSVAKRCEAEACEGEDATSTVFLAEKLSSLSPVSFASTRAQNR
ncbi:MAG: trypsin-like serine peptidase [Pseudobdellovibrionaceae bacterium]